MKRCVLSTLFLIKLCFMSEVICCLKCDFFFFFFLHDNCAFVLRDFSGRGNFFNILSIRYFVVLVPTDFLSYISAHRGLDSPRRVDKRFSPFSCGISYGALALELMVVNARILFCVERLNTEVIIYIYRRVR
uniref:Uncharacterized protein n=1 Tax=Ixodes ricinus TaxID=34613 RepID=A0A6B0URY3_IXORI